MRDGEDMRDLMEDWQLWAACRDEDPELFFPVAREGTEAYDIQSREALSICDTCPVQLACLLAHMDETVGVFGGTTPDQRHAVRGRMSKEMVMA
jgi:WhiB family redox-sensing transcriptional regulator